MKPVFSLLSGPAAGLALLCLALPVGAVNANKTPSSKPGNVVAVDVDGHQRSLHPSGQVTLVMYSNGDLEQQSRDLSRSLEVIRCRRDFHFVRVVDLRGEVAPIARRLVEKQIRKELDKEAARIKPLYSKNGNSTDPRQDMPTIADFNGSVLGKLGWDSHYEALHVVVFNKKGQEIRRFDRVNNPADVNAYLKTLL